jgi:hypothetical protein
MHDPIVLGTLTVLGILALIGTASYAVHHAGRRHYEEKGRTDVLDIGFQFIPRLPISPWVIDCVTLSTLAPLLLATSQQRFAVATRALPIILGIVIVRALTTLTTILPPDKRCVKDAPRLFPLSGAFLGSCYDKIFSGHLAIVLVIVLLNVRYGLLSMSLGALQVGLVAFLLIATRAHYTVDLVLACMITYHFVKEY